MLDLCGYEVSGFNLKLSFLCFGARYRYEVQINLVVSFYCAYVARTVGIGDMIAKIYGDRLLYSAYSVLVSIIELAPHRARLLLG